MPAHVTTTPSVLPKGDDLLPPGEVGTQELDRISDPKLNAATVAEAAGVSARYANGLLAKECTSIMRLALAMRLQRCRQALEDPLQNHRTLSEIARGWGFSDMTHFGRSFRAKYGVLPRDFRKSAKQR
jgi:AraC-like DNA-binding protein